MRKIMISSLLATTSLSSWAVTSLTGLNSFSSGTTISSSSMNANFTAIQNFVNGNVCLDDGTNCLNSGTVVSVGTGTGLVGGPITSSGTLSVDVGVTANKIVQLNGSAQLPAVDGSLLTSLNASAISTGTLPITRGGTGATTGLSALTALGDVWNYSGAPNAYLTTGNLGLGTASPANKIHVFTTTGTALLLQSSDTGVNKGLAVDFKSSTNAIAKIVPKADISTGGQLQFQTSADGASYATALALAKDGKIGIGTTTPNYIQSIFTSGTTGMTSAYTHYTNSATGMTASDGLLVGYGDGIGKVINFENTPISFQFGGAAVERIRFDVNGDVLTTSGYFNVLSDVRLKKDFVPLTETFSRLNRIHGYYYKLKSDSARTYVGVKAQDVEKAYPELVSTGKDGYKSVAYAQLVAPLIDGVNELHQRVSTLEGNTVVRTPASENRLKKLEAENAALKQWICAKDPAAPFCH